jgi:Ca2+-binding RTX toxin-like protein
MGSTAVTFGANDLKSIEAIGLNSVSDFRFDPGIGTFGYELTLSEGNVGETGNLLITGFQLQASERMTIDGSAILTGSLSLYGGAGGDTLAGGANGDLLRGNGGADLLRGNGGADTFQYFAATDSSVAASDRILDFTFGVDKIDLSRIDADITTADDQAFSFIGQQAFGNVAGQLRTEYDSATGRWLVQGDTDGDGQADFQIFVAAPNANTLFSSSDFML